MRIKKIQREKQKTKEKLKDKTDRKGHMRKPELWDQSGLLTDTQLTVNSAANKRLTHSLPQLHMGF